MFKKSVLIRILRDTVMKDIRRSPVIKLETTNYKEPLDIVQQIIKDRHGQVVPMDLDAVDTTSNDVDGWCRDRETESNFQGEIRGSQLEGTLQDDLILVYGHDGHICNMISSKGKGKGGKGRGHEQGGGTYVEGNCSFCGTYGHKRADCNSFTKYLKGKREKGKGKGQDCNASWKEIQRKVVGRHGSPKEELTKER